MIRLHYRLRTLNSTVRSLYGGGPAGYARLAWYSLLRPNRFLILAADTTARIARGPADGSFFQWIDSSELERLRSGRNWPREFYMDRTSAPSRCCLGSADGEPAYVHWVYMPGDRSRFLRIGAGAAEINYILTLPSHRGRGLCRAAVAFSVAELARAGIRTVYAVVHDGNVASIKALTRAGLHQVGEVHALGPFNRKTKVGVLNGTTPDGDQVD